MTNKNKLIQLWMITITTLILSSCSTVERYENEVLIKNTKVATYTHPDSFKEKKEGDSSYILVKGANDKCEKVVYDKWKWFYLLVFPFDKPTKEELFPDPSKTYEFETRSTLPSLLASLTIMIPPFGAWVKSYVVRECESSMKIVSLEGANHSIKTIIEKEQEKKEREIQVVRETCREDLLKENKELKRLDAEVKKLQDRLANNGKEIEMLRLENERSKKNWEGIYNAKRDKINEILTQSIEVSDNSLLYADKVLIKLKQPDESNQKLIVGKFKKEKEQFVFSSEGNSKVYKTQDIEEIYEVIEVLNVER
jgi:hypothetical protein